jgi:hypothetical protein
MSKLMNIFVIAGLATTALLSADYNSNQYAPNSQSYGNQNNPSSLNRPTNYNPNARNSNFQANPNNNLYVSDQSILQTIRSTLKDDKSISDDAKNVEIAVNNGAVTLTGSVDSDNDKARIEAITRQINGVNKINNNIKIKY